MAPPKKAKTSGGKSYSKAPPKKKKYKKTSPTKYIPSAGMTIGLAVANKDILMGIVNNPFQLDTYKSAAMQAIQPERLKNDALYGVGGYAAGYAIKKFAPKIVREPLGKIAKKIPRLM